MAEFNPNSTATKGLEWFPALLPSVTLDALTKSASMSMLQTLAQSIGSARVYVGAIPVRGGAYVLEVYDDEDAVAANLANVAAQPNEDVSGTGTGTGQWRENTGSAVTIFTQIDEVVFDNSDWISNGGGGGNVVYYSRMNTAGLALAGKRILAVKLAAVVQRTAPDRNTIVVYGLNIGGVDYFAPTPSTPYGVQIGIGNTWYYNPATRLPWTIADVQSFDSTNEWFIGGSSTPDGGVRVPWVFMTVYYVDENRLAVGALDDNGSALTPNAWNTVTLTTPTGGTWNKDAAGRHLYVVRRISDSGSLVIPHLDAGVAPNPARGFSPTLDATYGYATAMGSSLSRVFGLVQRTTAPADSVDSQPYTGVHVAARVYNGQGAQQEFSNAAAINYGLVSALVKPNNAVGDLLIKIRRRSDNVQLGGTVTVTAADAAALPDAGNGWRLLDRLAIAPAAGLAAATQYYIEFSDANATDDGNAAASRYWSVLTLDAQGVADTAGFGGATDAATINGAENTRYDIPATVQGTPTPLANFATALGSLAVTDDGSSCAVTSVATVVATWTASALAGSFARYEIERSDDGGATWVLVKEITDEATETWTDLEALRGVESCYRIRSVRTDGAASDWTASSCETPEATCCEWLFTSNVDPSITVALTQHGSNLTYNFEDADDRDEMEVYNRDHRLVFRGTEDRGYRFSIPVVVQVEPTTRGVTVFDELRALMNADVPYVALLDAHGNRFYVDVTVPEGTIQGGTDHFYASRADVVTVTSTPAW